MVFTEMFEDIHKTKDADAVFTPLLNNTHSFQFSEANRCLLISPQYYSAICNIKISTGHVTTEINILRCNFFKEMRRALPSVHASNNLRVIKFCANIIVSWNCRKITNEVMRCMVLLSPHWRRSHLSFMCFTHITMHYRSSIRIKLCYPRPRSSRPNRVFSGVCLSVCLSVCTCFFPRDIQKPTQLGSPNLT